MIHLPHLETNVTVACENRCIACNHFVPLQVGRFKSSMVNPADFATDLFHFGRLAHADAWAAIGGEPTLHPGLVDILRIARPIVFDQPHYREWLGEHADYVPEVEADVLKPLLAEILSTPPRPVTATERADVLSLCNWEALCGQFWEAVL
jgi:hypothetical protein